MLIQTANIEPSEKPIASVIAFHGLGANGEDLKMAFSGMDIKCKYPIRFIFPQAPMRHITINSGLSMPAWFDIKEIAWNALIDSNDLHESLRMVHQLIEQERKRGIPPHRIILGGFSQGAGLALYLGLKAQQSFAGLFALSPYFPWNHFFKSHTHVSSDMPIWIGHGQFDPLIPLGMIKEVHKALMEQGYPVEFHTYPIEHHVNSEEMHDLVKWLNQIFIPSNKSAEGSATI